MLFSRRLDTQDCDHKLIEKLLTKFINQARISHKLTCNWFFLDLDIAVQMFAIGQIARSVHISMAFTFQIWKLRLSIFPLTSLIMRLRTGYVSPSKKVLFSDT